jgi:tetratricopeptide (TPR) repeat protein
MKSILSMLTLVLFLNITNSAGAFEGICMQGNCKNGYGIFAFGDGRIYEGQWKKGLFDGMGKLIFISGFKYTGEFDKGLMHGYGKINLLNGKEKKCEVVNGEIQVDESTKQLWLKETTSEAEDYIVFLKIGDVYRVHRNYEKTLEYYNKALEINPDHAEAINNKNEVEKKIAEHKAKAEAQAPPKIVLKGSARSRPRTRLYGSGSSSTTKKKSSGAATVNNDRRYQVPDKVNRLKKAALGSGHHLSPGPVITTDSYK